MREAQLHRGGGISDGALEHDPEPRHPLCRIEVPRRNSGQRLELLVRRRLVMSMPLACRWSSTACSFTRLLATV